MRDITDRKQGEEQLRASLREKEILLKEIHHRVKNNLQVIASLLSLQSEYLEESKPLAMLEDMKNRVRSIAAIHEMLYGSADLSRIDFAGYLNSIAKDLMSLYPPSSGRIRADIDSDPIHLDITQAVPCGLIVNELLTNSFKHAFPENRSGVIQIVFRSVDGACKLEISDDGVGLPENLDPGTSGSMGMQLVTLLVQQLKGEFEIDQSSGTRFTILFPQRPI
jgi:two-component sensor histidine kinase